MLLKLFGMGATGYSILQLLGARGYWW